MCVTCLFSGCSQRGDARRQRHDNSESIAMPTSRLHTAGVTVDKHGKVGVGGLTVRPFTRKLGFRWNLGRRGLDELLALPLPCKVRLGGEACSVVAACTRNQDEMR